MEKHKRILGMDYGTVRIGISLSDPLRIMAHAHSTLPNSERLWGALKEIITSNDVEFIVVGMPFNLKNERSQKAKEVEVFIQRLKSETGLDVVSWDERFTTSIAQKTLLEMGTKKKDRRTKGRVDAMAAALILQGFLDTTKQSINC